ncbi:MAG: aspartate carbamoyltransferase regulatory subunit, partial [Candidatus Bathyarchaeia archaeon]
MVEKELRVSKIEDGTVIDHITAGYALAVLRIIGLTGKEGNIISILMNVPSQKLGRKDIVKVENRELREDEVHKIALIAPNATINIIRNYEVVEKNKVKLPKIIKGVIKCANAS